MQYFKILTLVECLLQNSHEKYCLKLNINNTIYAEELTMVTIYAIDSNGATVLYYTQFY